MIGIIFATPQEAAPFIAQYADGRVDELEEGVPVHVGSVLVMVSGPGKIKATLSTERLLQDYDLDLLLHTGACTALTDELEVGTLVGVSFVLEGDRVDLEAPTYPRMPLELPFDLPDEGTLVTQDHTTDDPDDRSYWERIADIRDNTGYAVAYVAAQHGTPCHIAKVVTARLGAEEPPDPTDEEQAYQTSAQFLRERIEAAADEATS